MMRGREGSIGSEGGESREGGRAREGERAKDGGMRGGGWSTLQYSLSSSWRAVVSQYYKKIYHSRFTQASKHDDDSADDTGRHNFPRCCDYVATMSSSHICSSN